VDGKCFSETGSLFRWFGPDRQDTEKGVTPMEIEIGTITHYYSHLNVAVLELTQPLNVGEIIHVLGHTTDFIQKVTSMEVNHHHVVTVNPGDNVALKVIEPVRVHDTIYRVTQELLEPHLN
jgi:putative protease